VNRAARTRQAAVIAMAAVCIIGLGFSGWYRETYWVFPGQSASQRLHWCRRDYEATPGLMTWRQISAQEPWPVHVVDLYPPLGFIKKALFASTNPAQARLPPDEVTSCTEGSQQGTESAGIILRQIVFNDLQDCADFVYIRTARPFPARVGPVPSPVIGIAQVDTPVAQGLLGLARPQAGVLKLGQHRPAARGQTGEL
jgi:hypothetical protein